MQPRDDPVAAFDHFLGDRRVQALVRVKQRDGRCQQQRVDEHDRSQPNRQQRKAPPRRGAIRRSDGYRFHGGGIVAIPQGEGNPKIPGK